MDKRAYRLKVIESVKSASSKLLEIEKGNSIRISLPDLYNETSNVESFNVDLAFYAWSCMSDMRHFYEHKHIDISLIFILEEEIEFLIDDINDYSALSSIIEKSCDPTFFISHRTREFGMPLDEYYRKSFTFEIPFINQGSHITYEAYRSHLDGKGDTYSRQFVLGFTELD